MAKQKFYVVWQGKETGIFTSWEECKDQVHGQIGAKYKSFKTRAEAEEAYGMGFAAYYAAHPTNPIEGIDEPSAAGRGGERLPAPAINDSIAVDAACSGNPGMMEYRGVYLKTGQQIFHYGPVFGTNNIGEFLAIVHGLALLKQKGLHTMPIYSDSRNAQLWVRAKKCKTKLERTAKSATVLELVARAEQWLRDNTYANPIIKWPTEDWGEIPADFGRK